MNFSTVFLNCIPPSRFSTVFFRVFLMSVANHDWLNLRKRSPALAQFEEESSLLPLLPLFLITRNTVSNTFFSKSSKLFIPTNTSFPEPNPCQILLSQSMIGRLRVVLIMRNVSNGFFSKSSKFNTKQNCKAMGGLDHEKCVKQSC